MSFCSGFHRSERRTIHDHYLVRALRSHLHLNLTTVGRLTPHLRPVLATYFPSPIRPIALFGTDTSYSYDTGSNPTTAHALLSVTHADDSHDYYSYDAQGRLANVHRDGGAADTTFSY